MNRLHILVIVFLASTLAGFTVQHSSAQGQAAAVYIYPRQNSTGERLKVTSSGSCPGSRWYFYVEHHTRFAPGGWSDWSHYQTVYIEEELGGVCADRYTVVDLLEWGETVQFRVTALEYTCGAPVYECAEDSEMTVEYNDPDYQTTAELGQGQSESTWWYYDDH